MTRAAQNAPPRPRVCVSSNAMLGLHRRKSGPAPLAPPRAWRAMIDAYCEAQRDAGRPETTIATRYQHVCRMARGVGVAPAAVTARVLARWFWSNEQWRTETRRGYRNSLVGFFRWAHQAGWMPTDPAADLAPVRPDDPQPRPAPEPVVAAAMLAATPRVMLMLRLAVEAGLRRGEVAAVHTRDVRDGPDGPQLWVRGKGRRERLVDINEGLAAQIGAGAAGHTPGLAAYGTLGRSGWLFPADDPREHLTARRVGELCGHALPGAWTMHTLRHLYATRVYAGTHDIRTLQVLLGHSSVATTQRYTAVSGVQRRAAARAALVPIGKAIAGAVIVAGVLWGCDADGDCGLVLHPVHGVAHSACVTSNAA